jgi:DHA2 family multidrug resistance protein
MSESRVVRVPSVGPRGQKPSAFPSIALGTIDPASMPAFRKTVLFILMALGQFMAILDIQIVASSLSDMQAGLAASQDEASWIQTAYLMAEIVMIPLSGWLAQVMSTRWLFTLSACGFTLVSAVCGLAWNIDSMIAARAVQGFIGGAMVPTAFATGFALFQGKRQALIPAVLGLLGTLAPVIGPTLGGWITETLSWRWLFFVNVIPGVVITIAVPMLGPVDKPDPVLLRRFDPLGLVLLAVSLGSLEYVLEEGYRWNWLDDETVRTFVWVAGVSSILFVVRTLTHRYPLVDLRALGNRTFAVACFFNFVIGFGMFGTVYILPLFLSRIRGFNALQIGDAVFAAGLSMVVSAPITALLSRRIDLRLMIVLGFSDFGVGLWLLIPIDSQWTGSELFWPLIVRGSALMFCVVPATIMALGALPPEKLKMASALFNTMRNLGGAVGIACVNTMLNDRTNLHWLRLSEHLAAGRPQVMAWMGRLSEHVTGHFADPMTLDHRALAVFAKLARREATTMAYADAFLMIAAVFVCSLVLVPLVRLPNKWSGSDN